MIDKLVQWDRDLFIWLNNLGIERYDSFWVFVTQIETWIPAYVFMFILMFWFFPKRNAVIATMSTIGVTLFTLGLTRVVKDYVQRLRPSNTPELAELIRVLQEPFDFSFWSGHSATSFAVTVFVVLVLRDKSKYVYLFFIWPILFAMSRVYVGVHYPGDLLVGALAGTTIAFLFYTLLRKQIRTDDS